MLEKWKKKRIKDTFEEMTSPSTTEDQKEETKEQSEPEKNTENKAFVILGGIGNAFKYLVDLFFRILFFAKDLIFSVIESLGWIVLSIGLTLLITFFLNANPELLEIITDWFENLL